VNAGRGIAVLQLSGELEIGRKQEIRDNLQLRGGEESVLVDCSNVTYADSTALAELLRFRGEAERRNVPVAILIRSRQFARIVQYAGLGETFEIFEDRGEALSYLAGGRTP
jgi:anti-anti-sigma factor